MTANQQQRKPCEECRTVMLVSPSRVARTRFCSRLCKGAAEVRVMNARRPSPKIYARPPVRRSTANNRYVGPISAICEQCRQPFQRVRQGKKTHDARFCSFVCKTAFWVANMAGENAPDYVGGPATYRGRNWPLMRGQVVAEQYGWCADCPTYVGPSMPVHHIRPYRCFASPDEANVRSNLIGLCQPCHMRCENAHHIGSSD